MSCSPREMPEIHEMSCVPVQLQATDGDSTISSSRGFVTKRTVLYGLAILFALAGLSAGIYVMAAAAPVCHEAGAGGGHDGRRAALDQKKWLADYSQQHFHIRRRPVVNKNFVMDKNAAVAFMEALSPVVSDQTTREKLESISAELHEIACKQDVRLETCLYTSSQEVRCMRWGAAASKKIMKIDLRGSWRTEVTRSK